MHVRVFGIKMHCKWCKKVQRFFIFIPQNKIISSFIVLSPVGAIVISEFVDLSSLLISIWSSMGCYTVIKDFGEDKSLIKSSNAGSETLFWISMKS